MTTKSGSTHFTGTHGNSTAFGITGEHETNAQEGVPRGNYTRNQFGFTAGGPIKKDKIFLFGGSEWIRVRSAASLIAGVPTPEFLASAAPNIQDFFNTYGGGKTFNFTKTYSASEIYGSSIPAGLDPATPVLGTAAFTAPQNAGGGLPQNTYNLHDPRRLHPSGTTQMFGRFVDYVQPRVLQYDPPGGSFAAAEHSQINRT